MSNGNGKKIKKPFEKWHHNDVGDFFNLTRVENMEPLIQWTKVAGVIPENWGPFIEKLRQKLVLYGVDWNEIELFGKFISLLLNTIDYSNFDKKIEEYGGRTLILPNELYEIKGQVDWMVARGRHEPQVPYFFLHEYKRFKRVSADPLGQLLIAMLAAQRLNKDDFLIYGAWIAGADWHFVVLDGNVYSESKTYDASDVEELTKIWLILNKTKQIIYDRVDKIIAAEKEAEVQSSAV